jgi:hypothetical protein
MGPRVLLSYDWKAPAITDQSQHLTLKGFDDGV